MFHATTNARVQSQVMNQACKRDRQNVIDITESTASSPAKSQRKNKQIGAEEVTAPQKPKRDLNGIDGTHGNTQPEPMHPVV